MKLKKPRVPEEVEQTQLFAWAKFAGGRWPELGLMHHIPNGGLRNKAVAAKLKAQGALPGVPDIFLPVARGGYFGMYVEMKALDGKLSEQQKEIIPALRAQGYYVVIGWGMDDAVKKIEFYLKMPRTVKITEKEGVNDAG